MPNQIELHIHQRRIFADAHEFGESGAYERLDGVARFRVDPGASAQATIVDLDKVATDEDGLVAFQSEICVLKPVDSKRGNDRLFFGYGNRGNKRELQFFNDASSSNDPLSLAHAGNGFLMRRGYTIVWCAWEGDILPGGGRMVLQVPVAKGTMGPITGVVRSEFISQTRTRCYPLSANASTHSYPTVSLNTTDAKLVRRRYPGSTPDDIAPEAWSFTRLETGQGHDAQGGEEALIPSDSHIYLEAGFEPGWIYELTYTAKDPLVLGLGHVAVRDLVSFLRYRSHDDAGKANPVGAIGKAYAWGRSQTGRCIRDFVHTGFNADEQGRRVFDGVLPHVSGAGLMWMNHRFACVVAPAGQQYEFHLTPADRFPFSYASCTNHLTGETDAILKRPQTDPLVIHTQTSTEYWQRRGSLVHTDTEGNDLEQPESVRIYLWSSSQHFSDPNTRSPSSDITDAFENIVQTSMLFRPLLDAMDKWATSGTPPPPSNMPKRADATLVTFDDWRLQFPAIPGTMLPSAANSAPLADFGESFDQGIVTTQPPRVLGYYPTLVPSVNDDGNEIPGVHAPMVQAPLGTYTGWGIRRRGHGHGAMFEFSGSYIPLPDSAEERSATGDPRTCVLERYANALAYSDAIRAAAVDLVRQGFLLEEDIPRCVAAAENWGRPLHDVKL